MKEQKNIEQLRFAIVATDIVLLRNNDGVIEFATQTVNRPPHYVDIPGFLGGVLLPDEISLDAAKRIIQEKANLGTTPVTYFPLGFYDAVDRDLRGRVVSLAYMGILESFTSDCGLEWHPLLQTKKLAYDHSRMLADVVTYFKEHLFVSTVMLYCMPKTFIISDLKKVYEYVAEKGIDKRNFYKFLESLPIKVTTELRQAGRGRPAQVYKKVPHKGIFLTQ